MSLGIVIKLIIFSLVSASVYTYIIIKYIPNDKEEDV